MIELYEKYSGTDSLPRSRNLKTCNVLAYVTPWNSYDIAKNFRGKFTHISPVWLNVEPDGISKFKITGTHDIDFNWMDQVRKDSSAFVVPRLLFSRMTNDHYISIIQNQTISLKLVDLILSNIKRFKLDGIVLELGVPIRYMLNFIKSLSVEIKSIAKGLFLFVVVPPYHSYHQEELFSSEDLVLIADFVDGLSLMTYDYSISPDGGPNSPIQWIADNVARLDPHERYRSKLLLGINLYGYDYSKSRHRQDVVGNLFSEIVKHNSVTCEWSKVDGEHLFEYTKGDETHKMYYPTLPSLNERIQLAQKMGTGLSLWEIGQGQDIFYELL